MVESAEVAAQLTLDFRGRQGLRYTLELSVRAYGQRWLAWREQAGFRSADTDRSRWRTHVESAPWAELDLRAVTTEDAHLWKRDLLTKQLALQTLRNVLNLVRCCFQAACDEGRIPSNPFRAIKLPRVRGARTKELWTVLRPEEQDALLRTIPVPDRWFIAVAMGTGLRQGELRTLLVEDVHLEEDHPFVTVRYGGVRAGKVLPTKSGRPRHVPLFGMALLAMGAWMMALGRYAPDNKKGLAFPTRRGCIRPQKPPTTWKRWLVRAGIERRVRFHDLRHTCASSLVAGWWGRAWSLEETCQLLGHCSVTVTERYAHFAQNVLERAADASDPARHVSRPLVKAELAPHEARKRKVVLMMRLAEEKGFEPLGAMSAGGFQNRGVAKAHGFPDWTKTLALTPFRRGVR